MNVVVGRRETLVLGLLVLGLLALGLGVPAGLCLTHSGPFTPAAGPLTARIVDDATGAPLAARVAVTDANGSLVAIAGKPEHVQQLGKRWCYVDGAFSVALPAGGATIEIRRGLETRPLVGARVPWRARQAGREDVPPASLDRPAREGLRQRRSPCASPRACRRGPRDAGGGSQCPQSADPRRPAFAQRRIVQGAGSTTARPPITRST